MTAGISSGGGEELLRLENLEKSVDAAFLVLCAMLVFFMQLGFALLEAGSVRGMNIVSIMSKNFADFGIGAIGFFLFGWNLAFGDDSKSGFLGWGQISTVENNEYAKFMFFLSFGATSCTIVSGACAERIKFSRYILWSFLNIAFVWPVPAHWMWTDFGWLSVTNKNSFGLSGSLDFAGSGVVHLCGATTGFIMIRLLGPRDGFVARPSMTPGGTHAKKEIFPHSPPAMVSGALILWVCWYAFNGGSSLGVTGSQGVITSRTMFITSLGAGAGLLAGLLYSLFKHNWYSIFPAENLVNGVLGGLVSVTAGCPVFTPGSSLVIGLIGGLLAVVTPSYFRWHRIDDPVNVLGVHGCAGIWGMVAVGIFAKAEYIAEVTHLNNATEVKELGAQGLFLGGNGELLGVQLTAALCFVTWTAVANGFLCYAINRFTGGLRVPERMGNVGLDVAEHNCGAMVVQEIERLSQEKQLERQNIVNQFTNFQHAFVQSSEQLFYTFATVSPVGIFQTDFTGQLKYVNDRFCELVAQQATDLYSSPHGWLASVHPEDRNRVKTQWTWCVRERIHFRSEFRFQVKEATGDTTITWVLVHAVPIAEKYKGRRPHELRRASSQDEMRRAETAANVRNVLKSKSSALVGSGLGKSSLSSFVAMEEGNISTNLSVSRASLTEEISEWDSENTLVPVNSERSMRILESAEIELQEKAPKFRSLLPRTLTDHDTKRPPESELRYRGKSSLKSDNMTRRGSRHTVEALEDNRDGRFTGTRAGVDFFGTVTDITVSKINEIQTRWREHQQQIVANLGMDALHGKETARLCEDMLPLIKATMRAPVCLFTSLLDSGEIMLQQNIGLAEGREERRGIALMDDLVSPSAHCILRGNGNHADLVTVMDDIRIDDRFTPSGLAYLSGTNAISGVAVAVRAKSRCVGTIECYYPNKVNFAREDLSILQSFANVLATAIEKEHSKGLVVEKKKADDLLFQLLPRTVAISLKEGKSVEESYDCVTILFSDIVGFTDLSNKASPRAVFKMINTMVEAFDALADEHGVQKIETIGDAYMIACGIPKRDDPVSCAARAASMALSMIRLCESLIDTGGNPLKLRIGISSGPCVAGVVGKKAPRYTLFGDSVNTASRMESTGTPGKIQLSESAHDLIAESGRFVCAKRGEVQVKGKGKMVTHWLVSKAD